MTPRSVVPPLHLIAAAAAGADVWVTANTTVPEGDPRWEGSNVIVSAATLTIDGAHAFAALTLTNGAVVTHSAATLTTAPRLDLAVAGTLSVSADSRIDVTGRGYRPGQTCGNSSVGASVQRSGGSHGGPGGDYGGASAAVYDSAFDPAEPGGGAGTVSSGGAGGGCVRIEAAEVVLNGSIVADGAAGLVSGGGGAGGGVSLHASLLRGGGGVRANGGAAGPSGYAGGGGGRVALHYATAEGGSVPWQLSARGGAASRHSGAGSVYTRRLGEGGVLRFDNGGLPWHRPTPVALREDPLQPDSLTVAAAAVEPANPQAEWLVSNLTVEAGGAVGHAAVSPATEAGLRVVAVGDIVVAAGGRIDATSKGYTPGYTLGNTTAGASTGSSGGSHGGAGGSYGGTAGATYGEDDWPRDCGAGGGPNNAAGSGGGRIQIAARSVMLDGDILAAGGAGTISGGGGAGGSVIVDAGALSGSGTVAARGGAGAIYAYSGAYIAGGGGGGRIALYAGESPSFAPSLLSAAPGAGKGAPAAGSVFSATHAAGFAIEGADVLADASGAVTGLVIRFNTGVDPASLDADRVVIAGPAGPVELASRTVRGFSAVLAPAAPIVLEGPYTLTVRSGAATVAGSVLSADLAIAFAIDRTPPAPPRVNGLDPLPASRLVSTRAITFTGTRDDESAVWVDGGETVPVGSGTWSVPWSLSEGTNDLAFRAVDAARNASSARVYRVVADTIPPAVTGVTPAADACLQAAPDRVDVQVLEAGSGIDAAACDMRVARSGLTVPGLFRCVAGEGLAWEPQGALLDGAYAVSVILSDRAGNVLPEYGFTFTVDGVPPPPPSLSPVQSPTTVSHQTVSGEKESGAALWVNGIERVPAGPETGWSVDVSLGSGRNTFSFTCRDLAGNVSAVTNVDIVFDDQAPGPVTGLVLRPEGDGESVELDWSTYDEEANGADLARYVVYVAASPFADRALAAAALTNAAGSRAGVLRGLTRGVAVHVAVVAFDLGGRSSPDVPSVEVVPVDTQPPGPVRAVSMSCGETSVALTWEAPLPAAVDLAGYSIAVDGVETASVPAGTCAYTVEGLASASSSTIAIRARDAAGNASAPVTAMAYTWLPPVDGVTVEPGHECATVRWSGVEPAGHLARYAVYRDAAPFGSVAGREPVGTATATAFTLTGLSNGQTTYVAVAAVNLAGAVRPDVSCVAATAVADTTGPALTGLRWNGQPLPATATAVGALAVDAVDPVGVASVVFSVDGDPLAAGSAADGSTYSVPWRAVTAPDGAHAIRVRAVDSLGNVSESVGALNVQLQPPGPPSLLQPAAGSLHSERTVRIAGRADANATAARVRVDGVAVGDTLSLDDTGAFSADVLLAEGTNHVTAVALNRAGESGESGARDVIVDTTVPPAPTGLRAASRELGVVRVSWTAPAGVLLSGYHVYRGADSFADRAAAVRVTGVPCAAVALSDLPPSDGRYVYRVASVSRSGVEGPLSDEAWGESDATLPEALSIAYTPTGPSAGTRFGAGTVDVRVTVSEPLLTTPFLSFTCSGQSPWLVPLSPAGGTDYAGTLVVTAGRVNGTWYANFAARDLAGNSGAAVRSGDGFVVDTAGPVPVDVSLQPVPPVRNDPGAPTSLVVVATFAPSSLPAATPTVQVRLRPSADGGWEPVALSPITSASWAGRFAFNAESGAPPGAIEVAVDAVDDLGNAATTCVTRSGWLVYQGDLPALPPPAGLTGVATPGGGVALAWSPVEGAADFEVFRRAAGSDTAVACGRTGGARSFAQTPPEGTNHYAVCSVRSAPPDESVGPPSAEVAVVADATAPDAPSSLRLALGGSGVRLNWDPPSAADAETYRVYRAPDRITPTSVANSEPILAGVPACAALDADPPQRAVFYAVTALDAAGNASPPSESVYTNLTLVPVTALSAVRTGAAPPVVSWRHAAPEGIGAYRVYGDDATGRHRLSPDIAPAAGAGQFTDAACGLAGRVYEVVAVDAAGEPPRESAGRRVAMPRIEAAPTGGALLWRGLMNRLDMRVVNRGPGALSNAVMTATAGGASSLSAPFCAPVGTTQTVSVVLPGTAGLPDAACVTVRVDQVAEGGERASVVSTHAVAAGNGMVTAELRHGGFIRGGEARASFTIRNPGTADLELVMARGGGTAASDEVRWTLETPEGFVLAVAPVRQALGDSLVTLADGTTVLRVPAGGEVSAGETPIAVPDTAGDSVVLRLTVDRLHHGLGGASPLGVAGFTGTCEGTVSETPYTATAREALPSVSRGEAVSLRGDAAWRDSGAPAANCAVAVCVRNGGVVRTLAATTDAAGEWTCPFTPESGRAGVFEVWAGHPDERASLGQCTFAVNRATVTPGAFDVTVPRNYEQTLAVTLEAASTLSLANARLEARADDPSPAAALPVGLHVTPSVGVTVAAGGRAELRGVFWGDNSAAATGTLVLAVVSDGETEPWASVPVRYRLTEAVPSLSVQPASLLLGVNPGARNTAVLRVGNTGYADLQDAAAAVRTAAGGEAAPSWARVTPASLGDVAPGAWRDVALVAEPPAGVETGVHDLEVVLSAGNHAPRAVAASVAVTASGAGDALFRVTDLYFGQVTGGVTNSGVRGATVRVRRSASLDAEQVAQTDARGECLFRDLPAGVYDYRVTAEGHDAVSGSVNVDPGVAAAKDVFLPCRVVSVEWRVVPTTIEDRYEIVLNATYETDVPAAVVVCSPMSMTLPDMAPGDVFQGEFRLRNAGLVRADNVRAVPPAPDTFFRVELTGVCPTSLAAGQEVAIPFRVTCLAPLAGTAGAAGGVYGRAVDIQYETICPNGQTQKSVAQFYLLGSTDSRVNPVVWDAGPLVITSPGGIGDTTVVVPGRSVETPVSGNRCTDDLDLSVEIKEADFAVGCGVAVEVSVDGCVGEGCPASALVRLYCGASAVVRPSAVSVPVGGTATAVLYGMHGSEDFRRDVLMAMLDDKAVQVRYTVVEIERVEAEDEVGVGSSTQARAVTLPAGWPVTWSLADVYGRTSQVLASIATNSGLVEVDQKSGYGWVSARAEAAGIACPELSGKQKKIEIDCVKCPSCDRTGGNGTASLGSFDVSIYLGTDSEGESAGRLYVYEESLGTNTWQPSGLRVGRDSEQVGVVYDATGWVRQVLAPAGVADVVRTNDAGYAVRWYGLDQVAGVSGSGLRLFDGEPVTEWAFRRVAAGEGGTTRVDVVKIEGGLAVTNGYEEVDDGLGEPVWVLTQGNGLKRARVESAWIDADTRAEATEISAGGGTGVVSRAVEWKSSYAWGEETERREVETGGGVEVSTWAYCTDSRVTGTYARVIAETAPGGWWATYGYDASGRLTRAVECWKDESREDGAERSKVTRYSYDPVDPRDDGLLWPDAVRCTWVEVCGVPTERSYAAYFHDDRMGRVEVSERGGQPGSAYGADGNPRTTTTYHPEDGSAADGRVERVERPDGRLDTYAYAYGTWTPSETPGEGRFEEGAGGAWRQVRVQGTVARPEGIALRTTREVRVRDENGRTVMESTEVYTGAGYERIAWTERAYDGRGREVRTVRSNGEVSEQAWGCCGKERDVDAAGGITVYALDALSRRTGLTRVGVDDAEFGSQPDRQVDYGLDAAGRQVSVTRRASGDGTTYRATTAYDLGGYVTNRVSEGNVRTRVSRHSGGRIERTVTADGLVRVLEAYRSGSAKCVTENGVLASWSDFGVNDDGTTWTQNWAGPLGTNSPAWQRSVDDALGRTLWTEIPAFGGGVLTNRFVFDATGRLARAVSPGMADRLFAYDELGEETLAALDVNGNGRIDLAGPDRVHATRSGYEFGGRTGGGGSGEGWWRVRVELDYPFEGSAEPLTNRVHRQRLTGFDAGCVAEEEMTDAWGNVTVQRREVDRERRLVRTVLDTPDSTTNAVQTELNGLRVHELSTTGVETRYTHDGFGRTVSLARGGTAPVRTGYGPEDRVLWTEDAGGGRTSYGFDAETGRMTSATNANTNAAFYAYDAWGRRTAEWGAVYPVLRMYDAFGRLSAMGTVRDAAAVITNEADFTAGAVAVDLTGWLYDDATGLLTNKVYADGTRVRYAYRPDRRVERREWARGVGARYAFDPASGQVTNRVYEGDDTPGVAVRHDRLGRPVWVRDGQGEREIRFGARGELSEEVLGGADGYRVAYAYAVTGVVGRLTGLSTDAGWSAGYGYDGVGRLGSVTARATTAAGARARTARYRYQAGSGRLEGWDVDDGWSVTRGFEADRPYLASAANAWHGVDAARHDYRSDAGGRRVQRTDSGSLWPPAGVTNEFAYNARDELSMARGGGREYAFAFDSIGNRMLAATDGVEATYAVNAVNAWTQMVTGAGATVSTYDADGNLLWDGKRQYKWDAENRLVACDPANETNGARRVRFAYDYAGRRVRADVDERAGGSWVARRSTRFVWSGWQMLGEWTSGDDVGGDAAWQFHVWGTDVSGTPGGAGGVGGLLFTLASDGAVFDYGYDGNGNVSATVESGTGDLAAHAYTPFGVATSEVPASRPRFGFSTKYTDPETGLLYYGYRYYSPGTGRWLSRDPLGEFGGVNLYTFTANNPINAVDRLGLALYAFDGTGTRYETWTHVSVLHRSYQGVAWYAEGVGSRWYSSAIGGATGYGGKARLNRMYKHLVETYKSGDKDIDIIGFSRGSSLAREFANMIHEQGIVAEGREMIDCDPVIRFVGLFDTVGSFGWPGNDINIGIRMDLPPNVQHAAHAIAQNERRSQFPLTPLNSAGSGQTFDQQVFPGDHSDIGGGHEEWQNLLALAPLYYMRTQGIAAGVPFGRLKEVWAGDEMYLKAGSDYRPWPYRMNTIPHDLTDRLLYTDGGTRENLPGGAM